MTTETQRPARRRVHPLLERFPLGVMSVATFLVVFALLMARVPHGTAGSPLPRAGIQARGGKRTTAATTRTRTSGAAAPPVAVQGGAGPSQPVVARASGLAAGTEVDDG